MFQEVRIPWVLLFHIAISAALKQYRDLGYLTPVRSSSSSVNSAVRPSLLMRPLPERVQNMGFMVLATGLYINACAKGEECIPQTIDMYYEKDGFMLTFWNFAGV